MPIELVSDHTLTQNENFASCGPDHATHSLPVRVQYRSRTIGLLGLIAVATLLACTVYVLVKYLL